MYFCIVHLPCCRSKLLFVWQFLYATISKQHSIIRYPIRKYCTYQYLDVTGKYCPWVLIELYRILGYFAIGALCSLLTTEMAKYKIGRLRPYFLDACKIRLTDELCKDKWVVLWLVTARRWFSALILNVRHSSCRYGYNIFVTDYRCKGNPDSIREASKSFLSGHSSFSFYCATFLIVYLHARLSNLSHDYRFVSYGKVRKNTIKLH